MGHRLRLLAPVIACLSLLVGGLAPPGSPVGAVPCRDSLPAEEMRASRVLAEERPFAPGNRDRFYSYDNPDWSDAAPLGDVDGPGLDERATRDALRDFLERRFPCAPERVRDGMAIYDNPTARQKVPEPTLRASLAALTGTAGEPAIVFLLERTPVTLINFGIYIDGSGQPGRVGGTYGAIDGTHSITIDRQFQFLPFAAFSSLLVHEALHTGVDSDHAGFAEETVAVAVEAIVYMEMLLVDPTLATLPDEFTRFNNRMALARLNSGPPGTDHLSLFVPGSSTSVDPVALDPLTEFSEFYAYNSAPDDPSWRESATTGNWLLWEIMARLAGTTDSQPYQGAGFDAESLAFVDRNQGVLSPAELVAVACILELDVPCASAAATSSSSWG